MAVELVLKNVAVIGAGASGLVAARELVREGHNVVVYERGAQVGGTWVYSPEVESDLLGVDPARKKVQTSLYDSLRTNLPREVMGFRDSPFVPHEKADRDSRRFPAHHEVLKYLEDFASTFGLIELIRFQTEVKHVGVKSDGKWLVKYREIDGEEGNVKEETYDAVVICNGHFTEPRIADNILGIDLWPGRQIHSHNYREPEPYKDQVVVLIGISASALDISRDIAGLAKEVHIAFRSNIPVPYGRHPVYDNMWLHPMIERAHEDGRISFNDGSTIHADVILHCTGYKYQFPFLDTGSVVNVDDNRVGPLYKHVFPPALAPGISFVGLPMFAIPFLVFELQSKWVAGVLSGRISLPSEKEMLEDIEDFYSELEAKGVPIRYTHKLHDFKSLGEFDYEDWLAAQSGDPPAEEWRKSMFIETVLRVFRKTEDFRDEWEDQDLVMQAYQEFKQYLSAD